MVVKPKPQLSREALEKIIREEIGGHHHYTCHIFCQAHWKIMGDKLMVWASQRGRVWCEHREWREAGWFYLNANRYVRDDEDICPVKGCHTPRPKDA